jgi:hypothetical protein
VLGPTGLHALGLPRHLGDLRISISAEAGKISAEEAREFAAGILRAADLLDQLTR